MVARKWDISRNHRSRVFVIHNVLPETTLRNLWCLSVPCWATLQIKCNLWQWIRRDITPRGVFQDSMELPHVNSKYDLLSVPVFSMSARNPSVRRLHDGLLPAVASSWVSPCTDVCSSSSSSSSSREVATAGAPSPPSLLRHLARKMSGGENFISDTRKVKYSERSALHH